jgi:hypothetical protein
LQGYVFQCPVAAGLAFGTELSRFYRPAILVERQEMPAPRSLPLCTNVFAFGREAQVRRSRLEDRPSFTFERNIVYWKEGRLLDGKWDEPKAAFDRNVYWRVGGGEFPFGKLGWEQ